jgi:putative peptide zinc metalloprotease protein
VWTLTRWDAILLVIVAQIIEMLRQLAPLVRFDGYHVLADVTGVPDLFHHIKPTLLGLLPQNWGKPEYRALKPWARAVVTAWVLFVVPILLGTAVLMVVHFPRVAATAWDSLGQQWSTLRTSYGQGDVADVAVRLVSILAIALPVFGMAYAITRLVRRLSVNVWRRTDGHPGRRATAVVTALAVLAGLAYAWWPEENRYRPIEAYERGTLIDALPMAAPTGLQSGAVARARTVWPAGEALPTHDRPALSVVLVPHDGRAAGASDSPTTSEPTSATGPSSGSAPGDVETADAGTWVFPFNRPPAPAEGDNQALAVNTEDGSTVYDVAFALVWAEDEPADNVNSAYALASCTGCTTVAVAFQVVLVLGQSDVVPQNLAAAVNYSCMDCVTGALAQQLVLTLDGPLSDATRQELAALWARIAEYGTTLEGRSLSEIRAQLTDFERQILAVLGVQAKDPKASTTASSPSASPTTSPTPSPTAAATTSSASSSSTSTSGAGSTTAPDANATATATPTGAASSTPEETTADNSEPSPTSSPLSGGGSTTQTPTSEPSPTTSPSP